jgi:hypothetical protein
MLEISACSKSLRSPSMPSLLTRGGKMEGSRKIDALTVGALVAAAGMLTLHLSGNTSGPDYVVTAGEYAVAFGAKVSEFFMNTIRAWKVPLYIASTGAAGAFIGLGALKVRDGVTHLSREAAQRCQRVREASQPYFSWLWK